MSLFYDHPTTPAREPETDQERAFIEAYRATEEAGGVPEFPRWWLLRSNGA